jgi:PAS domain S-box-containing protein
VSIAFEALPGGTVVLRDRRVVYASAGAAALAGRAPGDVVGMEFLDLLVPEQRERVGERYLRRLRGEPVPTEYETELLLPDGGRRVVEVQVGLDGVDFVVELRDVTARAARRPRLTALAQLGAEIHGERREEAIFARVRRGLADAGMVALLMRAEKEGARIAWASVPPALEQRFGDTAGRPLTGFAVPWSDFSRTAWERGAAYTDDWMQQVYEVMPPILAAAAREAAAEYRLTRAVAVRIDEHPGPRFYLVGIADWLRAEDLPALRLFGSQVGAALDAARRIAGLARHNADLFALNRLGALAAIAGDLDGFLTAAGDVLRRSTSCDGVAVFTQAPGGDLGLRFQDGVPAHVASAFGRVDRNGPVSEILGDRTARAARVAELPPARRERLAATGFATVAWVPLVGRSGTVGLMTLGWRADLATDAIRLGFLQAAGAHVAAALENARLYDDLTRSLAELARTQDQLIRKERLAALGELAAVVAHEVRNPLGVIFNAIGSLRRLVRPTGDAEMLLSIVDEEASRLNRIVGDLLDFARPTTPLLQLEPVERVVDEAVAAALARAGPEVKLEREVDPGLPPVPMDARLVHQAVLNVALNAVQAMPGGGRLRTRLARDGDAILLEVEDDGPGIPEDVRARVFEPFFTTKASGTGLGLAVVKRILEEHGGEVHAGGRPGAGAIVTLRFPISRPARPGEAVAPRAPVG